MSTAIIAVITIFSLNAQISFGVKTGLNLSSINGGFTGEKYESTFSRKGYSSILIGVVSEFKISEKFAFQGELLYSQQGNKFEMNQSSPGWDAIIFEQEIKSNYINIPLIAKYYIKEGFSLEAGPQIGFLLSSKSNWTENWFDEYNPDFYSGSGDIKDYKSSIDYGLNFGLGYKLDNGLNFGIRYYLGLANINNSDSLNNSYSYADENLYSSYEVDSENPSFSNQKNRVFQITVGYFIN